MCWADRDSQYSGARRGIGASGGHWELLGGVGGVRGPFWGIREHQGL